MFFDDLDSTGHVYMIDPAQQEMEIDYYARFDAQRERFSEDFCDEPTQEEMEANLAAEVQESEVQPAPPTAAGAGDDDIPF
jgi:hypothetical protein